MTDDLTELRERDMMDCAGTGCTYCRERKLARPMPVDGREFVPALCDDCYGALRDAERLDYERDRAVFYP